MNKMLLVDIDSFFIYLINRPNLLEGKRISLKSHL